MLEWVAIPFFRGIFLIQGLNLGFCIKGEFFIIWATRESWNPLVCVYSSFFLKCYPYLSLYLFFSLLILCCHHLSTFFWVVLPWDLKKFNQNSFYYLFIKLILISLGFESLNPPFPAYCVPFQTSLFLFQTSYLKARIVYFNLFRILKAFKAMNLSLSTALPTYTFKCSNDATWLGENIEDLGGSWTFIRTLPLI